MASEPEKPERRPESSMLAEDHTLGWVVELGYPRRFTPAVRDDRFARSHRQRLGCTSRQRLAAYDDD